MSKATEHDRAAAGAAAGADDRAGAATDEAPVYGGLQDSLGFLLRLSQLQSFAAFYEDLGDLGVKPGEMTVLIILSEVPGIRQGVLARWLKIKRANMSKMVRGLEAAGLIRREVPEDDGRAMELHLTEAGALRVAILLPRLRAHEARTPPTLTGEEVRAMKCLLRKYLGLPEEGR